MSKSSPQINPIQPVAVVSPIEMIAYPPPMPPTWLEVNVLIPLEKLSERFLTAVVLTGVLGMILELMGLLP